MKGYILLFLLLVLISIGALSFLIYRAKGADLEFGLVERQINFKK